MIWKEELINGVICVSFGEQAKNILIFQISVHCKTHLGACKNYGGKSDLMPEKNLLFQPMMRGYVVLFK